MHASTSPLLVVVLVVADFGLGGTVSNAKQEPNPLAGTLNEDRLGESLKRFRSRHKEVKCHRRPNEESDERKLKKEWLTWVDCGLEKGDAKLDGVETLAEISSIHPLGMFATFYKKKLVDLSYTLASPSIDDLIPTLSRKLGQPSQTLPTKESGLASATWHGKTESIFAELVPISSVVAEGAFLRIHKGIPTYTVRLHIYLNTVSPTEP